MRQTREDIAGPLRITGPRTVLQSVIGPVLDEYIRLYPEVQPDLQLDDRIGNWVEGRVDAGFRLGHALQEGLIAQRLFPMPLIIRAGRLIPLLTEHLADHCSLYVYHGSRTAVPTRVRRFIDMTVDRLTDSTEFVLSVDELAKAGAERAEWP